MSCSVNMVTDSAASGGMLLTSFSMLVVPGATGSFSLFQADGRIGSARHASGSRELRDVRL